MTRAKPATKPSHTSALPRIMVRSSDIHAAGCITLDPITKGGLIVEYDGERLTKHEADVRYEHRIVTYLFSYGDKGGVIDGFCTAMFINHSCAPNCKTSERKGRVFIRAIRNIAAGEELVYEYNLYDSELEDLNDCYCGVPNCRGTMYSEDEVKRRNRGFARMKARNKAKRDAARKRASPHA